MAVVVNNSKTLDTTRQLLLACQSLSDDVLDKQICLISGVSKTIKRAAITPLF